MITKEQVNKLQTLLAEKELFDSLLITLNEMSDADKYCDLTVTSSSRLPKQILPRLSNDRAKELIKLITEFVKVDAKALDAEISSYIISKTL